jgi:hypothetical protein
MLCSAAAHPSLLLPALAPHTAATGAATQLLAAAAAAAAAVLVVAM